MSDLYLGRQWVSRQASRQAGWDPRSAWHAMSAGVVAPAGTTSKEIQRLMVAPACGRVGQADYSHATCDDPTGAGPEPRICGNCLRLVRGGRTTTDEEGA